MMRALVCAGVAVFFSLTGLVYARGDDMGAVKKSNVAGAFYPGDADALRADIAGYLRDVSVQKRGTVAPHAVIVPHAGYVYSAPVAAYAYHEVQGRAYDAVVVIAQSHYFDFNGGATISADAYETPLGEVPVQKILRDDLIARGVVSVDDHVFEKEHSLEVQLPFVQTVLPNVPVVPVIFGRTDGTQMRAFAEAVFALAQRSRILLVCSSDLSHYHPYTRAQALDAATAETVVAGDLAALATKMQSGECEFCGYTPVFVFMLYSHLWGDARVLLRAANSGDTAGDRSRVVGYMSVVSLPADKQAQSTRTSSEGDALTKDQQDDLLALARQTVEMYVTSGKVPDARSDDPVFSQVRGAFVTLHKNGELRGCIGNYGKEPLAKTIVNMAVAAASEDPRFKPVTREELKDIEIEISVLSPLRRARSADEIVLGKHGVIVKKGFRQGVFLPQVATETGWSKEEFLGQLCAQKAGLPYNAWADPSTELTVFTAQVFSEEHKQ
jgi:AmmeMemoRadiSam system protein B/AmmeMemoRadiSam system protein A